MKKQLFEQRIIDTLLNLIKKHQVYLTQPENLGQLAKLGYIYNTLWYGGRLCLGSGGIIKKEGKWGQCEDNPKYKIEMCEPENETIENYIYDAWGMHVSNNMQPNWEEFTNIINGQKEVSPFQQKLRKPNKTFDEWVEVLTDDSYSYTYESRRDVANHLLCVIGNGYGYKDGFIISEASGADVDIDEYGFWENAEFGSEIRPTVDMILTDDRVKEVIVTAHSYISKANAERQAEEDYRDMKVFGMPYKEFKKTGGVKELNRRLKELTGQALEDEEDEYHTYYPISEGYSEITKFDTNTHPSYIAAGIEICKDILVHEKQENESKYGNKQNVVFAKQYLAKFDINI